MGTANGRPTPVASRRSTSTPGICSRGSSWCSARASPGAARTVLLRGGARHRPGPVQPLPRVPRRRRRVHALRRHRAGGRSRRAAVDGARAPELGVDPEHVVHPGLLGGRALGVRRRARGAPAAERPWAIRSSTSRPCRPSSSGSPGWPPTHARPLALLTDLIDEKGLIYRPFSSQSRRFRELLIDRVHHPAHEWWGATAPRGTTRHWTVPRRQQPSRTAPTNVASR